MMEKVYLICDESGAKGYSDKEEVFSGEVGVMAGYLLFENQLNSFQSDLEKIRTEYLTNGRLHITDINEDKQAELRNKIFSYLNGNSTPCVYEAVHVQGFFEWYDKQKHLHEKLKAQSRSNIEISGHAPKELLHAHLFQGIFGKAVAYFMDSSISNFFLNVTTDILDKKILKEFETAANDFFEVSKSKIFPVSEYDPDSKQVVSGQIISQTKDPTGLIPDFSGIQYSINCEDSCFTLAADVLANSINYHFVSRSSENSGEALNTFDAIKNHPLSGIMYGLWDPSEGNYVADAIFMHPSSDNSNKSKTT